MINLQELHLFIKDALATRRLLTACRCHLLTHLTITHPVGDGNELVDPSFISLLRCVERLEELNLTWVARASNPAKVVARMTNLERLTLRLCIGSSEEGCNFLFDALSQIPSLAGIDISGHPKDLVLTTRTLRSLTKVLQSCPIRRLLMADLPGLFEHEQDDADYKVFLRELGANKTLDYFYLFGTLGLGEGGIIDVFRAMEHNQVLDNMGLKGVAISVRGWERILDSLSRNNRLSRLCIDSLQETFLEHLHQVDAIDCIAHGLQRNTGLTCFRLSATFKVTGGWYHVVINDHVHEELRNIAERNRLIRKTRTLVPSSLGPIASLTSLLPSAMAAASWVHWPPGSPTQCPTAVFALIQNFAPYISS
jgi:hypothetical protein